MAATAHQPEPDVQPPGSLSSLLSLVLSGSSSRVVGLPTRVLTTSCDPDFQSQHSTPSSSCQSACFFKCRTTRQSVAATSVRCFAAWTLLLRPHAAIDQQRIRGSSGAVTSAVASAVLRQVCSLQPRHKGRREAIAAATHDHPLFPGEVACTQETLYCVCSSSVRLLYRLVSLDVQRVK